MRRLLVLASLLIARNASANQCTALQRFVMTPEIPVGCPLVLYQDHEWHNGMIPSVTLQHAGTYSQLTPATAAIDSELLSVYFETIDDNCVESNYHQERQWDRI